MKIKTDYPIAFDSPDHLYPWGTKNDNHTSPELIREIEKYFVNKRLSILDIGCSGGQFVLDFHNRGHLAVGIEGSDYSIRHQRANWPAWHNRLLFTCDASRPYEITDDQDKKIIFDCISAWEVIEHIHPDSLDQFFENISNHMHDESIFIGSVSLVGDYHDGNGAFDKKVELHQSIFSKEKWVNEILGKRFNVFEYDFSHKVRHETTSFYVRLTKKKI